MGINARIETEGGESITEVLDPMGYVSWILGSHGLDATVCLRFIDPYGDTIFNQGQLHVLLSELESRRATLTTAGLESAKEQYLRRATAWPEAAVNEAQRYISSLSADEIRGHLEQLVSLVRRALDHGAHHYVRFIGD